jgi:hypothetical protein
MADQVDPRKAAEPCYFADLATARLQDQQEWKRLREKWRKRFHVVHFEHYSAKVPAAFAEVTPLRPPYDYRGQEPVTRRGRRNASDDHPQRDSQGETGTTYAAGRKHDKNASSRAWRREPTWTYWREVLVTFPPTADQTLNAELCQLANLYLRASNFTDPEDAAYCHRLLRPALTECVSYYDCTPTPNAGTAAASTSAGSTPPVPAPPVPMSAQPLPASGARLDFLRARREAIEQIYERCAARRTITQYTVGMLLGLLALPVLFLLNLLAFYLFAITAEQEVRLPSLVETSVHVGTVMGAVGAVSSVLLRINSSRVDLDLESTRHGWHVWLNPVIQRGVARVVIGIIFGGVAAWFVLAGVLVPDAASLDLEDPESTILMVGVLAYISGFSERFIPDLIIRTART